MFFLHAVKLLKTLHALQKQKLLLGFLRSSNDWISMCEHAKVCFLLGPAHATLDSCNENHDYFDLYLNFFNSASGALQGRGVIIDTILSILHLSG